MEAKKRKRNPAWKDSTIKERSALRRQRLDEVAQLTGYESWRKLETAVLAGDVRVEQVNPTAIIL